MTTRSITSRHATMFVLTSMIGIGIMTLPRALITKAGSHAWLAVLIGSVFPLIGVWIQVTLCNRHPEQNFTQLCKTLLGSTLGTLVTLAYIGYALVVTAITCRGFIDLISVSLFFRTPKLVLLLLFASSLANATQFGARIIGRIHELLFFVLLPLPLFYIPSLIYARVSNLLPLFPVDLKGILSATPATIFSYLGYESLMFVYWLIADKKHILRYSLWATLFVVLQYLLLVVISIVVIGPKLIGKFVYPTLALVRSVEFPVLERLDLYALVAYTFLVFRPCVTYYYITADTSARLFGKEPQRWFVWALIIPVCLLANLPKNSVLVNKVMSAVGVTGIVFALGIPAVLLVVSYWRGRK